MGGWQFSRGKSIPEVKLACALAHRLSETGLLGALSGAYFQLFKVSLLRFLLQWG